MDDVKGWIVYQFIPQSFYHPEELEKRWSGPWGDRKSADEALRVAKVAFPTYSFRLCPVVERPWATEEGVNSPAMVHVVDFS